MLEPEKSDEASGDEWVSRIVSDQRTMNPLMSDDLFLQLESLLSGQMAELGLTPSILKGIANDLLECNRVEFQEQEESN